jgi:hypothetical protein
VQPKDINECPIKVRVVDIDKLGEKLISNSLETYKGEKILQTSKWSIAVIICRRNGANVINNCLTVIHKDKKDDLYRYSDDKSDWQLKSNSIIVFNDSVGKNDMFIFKLNQKVKNNLKLSKVSATKGRIVEDYAYVNNNNNWILPCDPNEINKTMIESHKNLSGIEKEKILKKNSIKRLELVAEEGEKNENPSQEDKKMKIYKDSDFAGIDEPPERGVVQ